ISFFEPNSETGSSKAVMVDDVPLVHTAQMLPLDEKGNLVGPGDGLKQAEQVLTNLAQLLKAADSSLANIVKINFYLANTNGLKPLQQILASEPAKPAASFVIGGLSHPGALIAADAVAISSAQNSARQVKRFSTRGSYEQ